MLADTLSYELEDFVLLAACHCWWQLVHSD